MENMKYFQPSVSHRFLVNFMFSLGGLGMHSKKSKSKPVSKIAGGANLAPVPNVLDVSFQRVGGLTREVGVSSYSEGGENLRNFYFTEKVTHGSLILERGVMPLTPLGIMFNAQLLGGHAMYVDVIVTLLDFEFNKAPWSNWLIVNALPVSWKTGDLDANSDSVLINTMELRYQEMIPMGIKQ
jgi:phage tail-like protein